MRRAARDGAVASVEQALREAARRLVVRAGNAARLEAEVLLVEVLGVARGRLAGLDALAPADAARFEALVDERVATARPVAYLTGRRAFRERWLRVDERVLIPRPESELLVEQVLALDGQGRLPPGPLVDRGTGSGALALCLAARRAVLALDLSPGALDVARDNLANAPPDRPVLLVRGDGLACLRGRSVAAVVANPPYVSTAAFAALPDDVRLHEPALALVPPGGDVTAEYGRLAAESQRALVPGGWLLTEVGDGMAADVASQLGAAGFAEVASVPDLAGIPRIVVGRARHAGPGSTASGA